MSCSPSAPAVFGYSLPSTAEHPGVRLGSLSSLDERHPAWSHEWVGSLRVDVERREHEELGDDHAGEEQRGPSSAEPGGQHDGSDREHGEERASPQTSAAPSPDDRDAKRSP